MSGEEWGRPGNIYHMMTSGGRKVNVGGRGSHSNTVLEFIIEAERLLDT